MQSREPKLSDILSVKDVCEWAGISPSTVTRHVQGKQLATVARLGGHKNSVMLFDRAEVAAWMAVHYPERLR